MYKCNCKCKCVCVCVCVCGNLCWRDEVAMVLIGDFVGRTGVYFVHFEMWVESEGRWLVLDGQVRAICDLC